jgi:MFS superfamily sulfate permease-like transporter
VLRGVLPLRRSAVAADVLAGVTLAALAIPQALGYAKIAGAALEAFHAGRQTTGFGDAV